MSNVKYNITLSDKGSRFLEEMARKNGITKLKVVENALAFYDFLLDEYKQNHTIMIKTDKDTLKEIVPMNIFPKNSKFKNGK